LVSLNGRLFFVSGDRQGLIATSAFLTSLLLIAVSPFAIRILRVSLLAWWFATSVSGMALIGLTGVLLMSNSDDWGKVGPGFYCLIASQALNFLGLLFIRREQTPGFP
jgi:hypothetical protein